MNCFPLKKKNADADESQSSVGSHLDLKSVPLSSLMTLGLKSTVFKKLHNYRFHEKMSHVARKPDFCLRTPNIVSTQSDRRIWHNMLIGKYVYLILQCGHLQGWSQTTMTGFFHSKPVHDKFNKVMMMHCNS